MIREQGFSFSAHVSSACPGLGRGCERAISDLHQSRICQPRRGRSQHTARRRRRWEKGRASLGTQMRAGDRLSVAANGFAEALLNPGSYLRLSENTEIRAVNIDFDSVRFELIKGSVIAEIGQIDKKTPIEIVTPHGALTIAKAGLSRIDAKGSATLVAVRQGEIHLGTRDYFLTNQSLKIKRGKVVTLTGPARPGPSDIAKLDQDAIDKFDTWSSIARRRSPRPTSGR